MNELKSFKKGGVHPHDHKKATADLPIRNASVPSRAVIPLHQHMGKPALCTVKAGDTVTEGMLIGQAAGFFSANVSSSIPGTVTEITEIYQPNGLKSQAVVVELAGEFEKSGKTEKKQSWENLDGKTILDKIADTGIVGLGGATFPTHIKYAIKEGARVTDFVVNGVECEPYLTCDYRLMLEKTAEILTGIQIVSRIIKPERITIGIENNKPQAISHIRKQIRARGLDYRVVPLKMRYPQGDEKQLLKAVVEKEVPSGGLPLDIGAVVSNVGTLHAIYEAVVLNKPLIERIVTVTGSVVNRPANLKVRVGTKISELIEECGGFSETPAKIIVGGPMMGFAIYDLDTPVTKGTSGIIALSRSEVKEETGTNCLSCGRCIRACPMGLNPTTLYKYIDFAQYERAKAEHLLDCKECGCCSYSCPARLPLVHTMKLGKLMLRKGSK